MKDRLKIKKLWNHLRIQDERLFIRVDDRVSNTNDIIIVSGSESCQRVKFRTEEELKRWLGKCVPPFRIIQQRGDDGMFEIPDIDTWCADENLDY